jgi:hypothetical protein
MAATWHFKKKRPDDKIRDPILGEFFATDAIRNAAEALVREGIQNSLDAKLSAADSVRIRIFLARDEHALTGTQVSGYFRGAWSHFHADRNGLREPPKETDSCPFLVFEDFQTCGLRGDVEQWDEEIAVQNLFFYFFRAESRTSKSAEDRGRWGVGKYVFPRASRANSFFGVTVRSDDRKRLLMGQAVLKHHKIGSESYRPDGDFGELGTNGLVLPLSDAAFIDQFSRNFHVARRADESGLSIVVPWVDPEITRQSLIEAVARGYFYPILTGGLVVEVITPADGPLLIDDSTLVEAARSLGDGAAELIALIELGDWASTRKPREVFVLKEPLANRAPKWSEALIPEELIKPMRDALQRGERLAIKVPLTVREKGKTPQQTFFHVFLVRGGNESGRPVFIREGIIVSDIRPQGSRARGIRSLVIVEDRALATMLGDSENPAHTQWQKASSNFEGKYVYGPSCLDFVVKSVAEIVWILSAHEREKDVTLLVDIFSLPTVIEVEPEPAPEPKPKPEPGPVTPPVPPLPPPTPPRFVVQKVAGGFRISEGKGVTVPLSLDIRAACDVRRGNPFSKYDAADFDLATLPIKLDPAPEGLAIISRSGNRIDAIVRDAKFSLTVVGFDERRDVIVNARAKEKSDDTET